MTTKEERQAFIVGLPWITKLAKPKEHCDGIKWGTVAMKDIYPSGPRANQLPARGFQERSLCKNKGRWKFRALRLRGAWAQPAQSGAYCWPHLMQKIYYNDEETARFDKAWEQWKVSS